MQPQETLHKGLFCLSGNTNCRCLTSLSQRVYFTFSLHTCYWLCLKVNAWTFDDMVNQANHLSATYLTVMYESRTQSNYNQYCFSVKSPSLAFVVVVSGNVSVIYLVARMEGRNGDQMYLLKVANVIAFVSRRPPRTVGNHTCTMAVCSLTSVNTR